MRQVLFIGCGRAQMFSGVARWDAALIHALRTHGVTVATLALGRPWPPGERCSALQMPLASLLLRSLSPTLAASEPNRIDAWLNSAAGNWLGRHSQRLLSAEMRLKLLQAIFAGPEGALAMLVPPLLAHCRACMPAPDAIVLNSPLLWSLAPALQAELAAPVLGMLQDDILLLDQLDEPAPARQQLQQAAARLQAVLLPYHGAPQELAPFLLAPGAPPLLVVPPAVDPEVFTLTDELITYPLRLGWLGSSPARSGLALLHWAFAQVAADLPADACVLCLAGSNAAAHARLQPVAAGTIEDNGELCESSKVTFLQCCTMLCLPQAAPGSLLITALEAMACGVPVILPAQGGGREIFQRTGGGGGVVLVPPGDRESLLTTLLELAGDPSQLRRLGRAAAQQVRQNYSYARTAAAFMQTLD